ncbi:MAG: fumarylacetoacetate hydrolase family protein [Actinobacteria bacterium]|nr:fumarylacetoacetate hydrolase family protein [Actinomycetota bacterium]
MKFLKFRYENKINFGILEENGVVKKINGNPFYGYSVTNIVFLPNEIELLPPCSPSKIIAIGLNYIDHAKELKMSIPDEPIIFLKPPSSLLGPEGQIIYPEMSNQVDYETELAIVMKDEVKNISEEESLNCILGFTCANDVTARDLQKKDGQWTRAKSFDTFSPIGPYIVTDINPDNLKIELFLNGEIKQSSSTSNMIFNVRRLIGFISNIMTLYPEDIIMTGTPPGVGPVKKGDTVEVKIEGIGSLRNYVN